MENYLTGRAIMEHRELQPFQFLELVVEQGLEPREQASGRPWPVLIEPEYWLYRVERVLWSSAGLLLMLFDSSPSAKKLTPDILAQMPRLYHHALSRLAAGKPPGAGLYEFQPETRLPRRLLPRVEAKLWAGILENKHLIKEYRLTAAMLQAACPQDKNASLFDLANSFNNLGNLTSDGLDCPEAEFASDVIDRLISDQDRNRFINHIQLEKILIEGLPTQPLADFCLEYLDKAPGFSKYQQTERSSISLRGMGSALKTWGKKSNTQRMTYLSQIARTIRRNFPSTPLPLKPETNYIGLVLWPEEFERLQGAVFKVDRLTLPELQKQEKQANITIVSLSETHIGLAGRQAQADDSLPADTTNQAMPEEVSDLPPASAEVEPATPEEVFSPPSPPVKKEIEPGRRDLAKKYRALKAEAKNENQKLALEAMAKKIEGQPNWWIFRELGLKKTSHMLELESQIKKGEPESRFAAEKKLKERQTQELSKIINKYGKPFAKKIGFDWQKDNSGSRARAKIHPQN